MGDQLVYKLLIEHFDSLPTQCRHIEHMHEGLWFPKTRTLTFFQACLNKMVLCLFYDNAYKGRWSYLTLCIHNVDTLNIRMKEFESQ